MLLLPHLKEVEKQATQPWYGDFMVPSVTMLSSLMLIQLHHVAFMWLHCLKHPLMVQLIHPQSGEQEGRGGIEAFLCLLQILPRSSSPHFSCALQNVTPQCSQLSEGMEIAQSFIPGISVRSRGKNIKGSTKQPGISATNKLSALNVNSDVWGFLFVCLFSPYFLFLKYILLKILQIFPSSPLTFQLPRPRPQAFTIRLYVYMGYAYMYMFYG